MKSERELENAIEYYGDMIKKICYVHTKEESDVDDIFQTVFLKYFHSSPFQDTEHEKAWLIRVSINACNDMERSWFKRKVILSDDISTYQSITKSDGSLDVIDAVIKLPTNYKNVIYLHYYEGYKIREMASILKKKENTIHTWLKRSKELLKEMLGGDYFA